MIIRSVELTQISPNITQHKDKVLPAILFFGKSNVGKSSLINSLLKNKKIARISSKPGKTTNFHWYLINQSFFFVDAPGYGYAKVPLTMRKHWETQFSMLLRQTYLILILHLTDLRNPLSELDKKYHKIILQGSIPYTIITTKSDALSKNQKIKAVQYFHQELQKEVFTHSIKNQADQKEIWQAIEQLLPSKTKNKR